ncbi:TetR/AcrR family transcriptional regulator [Tumebacillus lipolyticus]|uniref:TetR/AcrR family transcriptional regulator n=1 Tax=Tumebacillus lipolyticus TaxID=1280370 RepID=A0ABW4ZT88_9BACL
MSTTSTYEVILETGYRLFAEHGFEKTSMAMIAKEVGISKPALYYHFVSKESLIDALLDEICKSIGFSTFFSVQNYTNDNFVALLISDGLSMVEKQKEDPYYSRIMNQYQALGYRNTKYSQRLLDILDGYRAGFTELLQHGASLGSIDGRDLSIKAQMLTMIMDSIDNFTSFGFEYEYAAIWKSAVLRLVRGVDEQ